MRKIVGVITAVCLVFIMGCACEKYELALTDLDKSIMTVEESLTQTMDMANEAAKAAGEAEPLYDTKDREARIRTCWEMYALIHTTLLGKPVKYTLPTADAPGKLYYEEDGKEIPAREGE